MKLVAKTNRCEKLKKYRDTPHKKTEWSAIIKTKKKGNFEKIELKSLYYWNQEDQYISSEDVSYFEISYHQIHCIIATL